MDGIGEILAEDHISNWDQMWDQGLITLEGPNVDLALSEAIIGAFYYLYSSLPAFNEKGHFFGLSPGGLANGKLNQDYMGHVFWDMVSVNA